ncbi:glutathione S-transferase, partial [Pseudomonas amygdali pv. tabaci str. ATCC 11528]
SHEPSVAVARFIQFYLGLPAERMTEYRAMQKSGYRALAVMEQQLDRTPFLVGENFSIADIALYAYTHVAHQGGFDLAPYTGIRRWLDRVKAQPGYVGMLD